MLKVALIVGVAALLLAGGAALFIESGVYDIGADDHHTKPVLAIIEQLRERSIAVRARSIEVYDVSDPEGVAAGGRHYAALCVGCHLAPGISKSAIGAGGSQNRWRRYWRSALTITGAVLFAAAEKGEGYEFA